MSGPIAFERRVTLAINLQLRSGPDGASARIELHLGGDGATAVVRVNGRLEETALRRLAQSLEDLAARGVKHLLLDCSELGDISFEIVGTLIEALTRFASGRGDYAVCGLSTRLRDRFRFAGCEAGLRPWSPSISLAAPGSTREWAS